MKLIFNPPRGARDLRAQHRKEKRRRRAEMLRARRERKRVERLLRQLTNEEVDEGFERAISK